MEFDFYNPVKIKFGKNHLEEIKNIPYENILLITSEYFKKNGLVDKIKKLKHLTAIIDTIPSNPQIQMFASLHNLAESCDAIIAVGGGSVLDVAKILSLRAPIGIKGDDIFLQQTSPIIPVYAFPTTAGTSSELTPWATIWDKSNNKKYSLHLKHLYCKEAIYDCTLMMSLPEDITISSALDALSHAIESIWNKNANPISTHNALNAISLITNHLPDLIAQPNSLFLREQITLASIFAGLAFSSTQTALAHAMSYPITMQKNIPHGIACSFTLPFLLDHLTNQASKEILSPFIKPIKDLFKKLKVATEFKDYNISKKDIETIFQSLNARAKNSLFDLENIKSSLLGKS
ncbi:phosphonoacetaldehyde reductase [Helicobacter sp. 11S02596-1]|uniref:phosphonoacetaldehyde reductase n=1 Tax=Helicobacter sp. 11S02596-1 TaxID=1476194 RepID=UPI000BA64587|nr:phosphonoacetaldehyde reductase [Helicobacter sp. 11S02596-1]PAF45192.1 hypothetical protein BJI48_01105 [Helicobacter sp. 11S02596-1]